MNYFVYISVKAKVTVLIRRIERVSKLWKSVGEKTKKEEQL